MVRVLPILLILAAVAALAAFGVKALRDKRVADEVAPYESVFAPNITIDGIQIGGMTAEQAHYALTQHHEQRVNSWQLALTYQGHIFTTITYRTLGLSVMTEQINAALKEAWELTHTGDAYQKRDAINALATEPFSRMTAQSQLSDQKLRQLLNDIAANIGLRQPVDASLVQFLPDREDPFLFQPEQVGYRLDVDKAQSEIMALASSGASGAYEFEPEEVQPAVTLAQLRKQYTLRSVAQTAISRSSPQNRNWNIEVSLGRVNGLILKPGAVFSFNKVAGQRTLKNGYYEAEEMVYGDLVTGIGGGVCQSSTTIYQAALKADLSIVSRRAHSDPVNYTDPGLDATVYYFGGREIDFKFRNSTKSDLYFSARVKGSGKNRVAEVRIFGESLGEGVSYELSTQVLEVIAPPSEPVYRQDKRAEHVIYQDQVEVYSKAKEGMVVETTLKRLVNGKDTGEGRTLTKDTYRPKPEVLWKGVTPR